MKEIKISLCLFVLFWIHNTSAQSLCEISVQGAQHINDGALAGNDRALTETGQSVGIRLGLLRQKHNFHFSLLYSRMDERQPLHTESDPVLRTLKPERSFLRLQLLYRRNFFETRRVFPFAGIGICGFLFDSRREYSGPASPLWPGQEELRKDRVSLLATPGIRCIISSRLTADIEAGVNYFFLRHHMVRNKFGYYLGVAFNLVIQSRTRYSSEPGYNPTSE